MSAPSESIQEIALPDLIDSGESDGIEFKASLRYDMVNHSVNNELIVGPVKTVAAYLNTAGGTLLVGVKDNKAIIGIAQDLATLKRGDADEFERHLRQALVNAIGAEYAPLTKVTFPALSGLTFCRVDVTKSPKPIFLQGKQGKEFYIRSGNGNRALDPEATHDYIQMHWSS